MKLAEQKYLKGIIDADSVDAAVAQDAYTNAENVRFGTTDAGVTEVIESVGSNRKVTGFLPVESDIFVIGHAVEESRNRIVYFVWSSIADQSRIVCYDLSLNPDETLPFTVLSDVDITGGLGFNKYNPIHSARIVNGILYWVDGLNEARSLNIDAGIKSYDSSYPTEAQPYTFPIDFTDITLIKVPPVYAPNIVKNTDGTVPTNFIANESFQFAYSFVNYTNEESVLSTFSIASRLNAEDDTYNRIVVTMNPSQAIPQTVRMVNLWVRYANTVELINTWDRDNATESAEIDDQNNGVTPLTYNFYNNIAGQKITETQALKPFESIPRMPVALEVAKNRLFLAGGKSGFDTPQTSSLDFTLINVEIGSGDVIYQLILVTIAQPIGGFQSNWYKGWYIYTPFSVGDIDAGYHAIESTEIFDTSIFQPPDPVAPSSTSIDDLILRGQTETEVRDNVKAAFPFNPSPTPGDIFEVTPNLVTITGATQSVYNIYKSASPYKIAIAFYDFAMRKCSVVSASVRDVNIPQREFDPATMTGSISWTLSNTDALNEIPDWAYYYAPIRTLNLRTRNYIQAYQEDGEIKYATKNTTGEYEFTATTFTNAVVGIGLDTTSLLQAGLGYAFAEGDICILIDEANTVRYLPVIGQSGKYIIIKAADLGGISTGKFIYEIYTPYKTSEQEPFYEVGAIYPVVDPTTNTRQYSTTSGEFLADTFVLTRSYDTATYLAEAMSPNDLYYQRWDTDAGKVNILSLLGEQDESGTIRFSNTFIPGTTVNGLSTFEALNETQLPQEVGAIKKLQLTSKIQNEQGVVMLAISTLECCSLYLGETQILDSTGAVQFFASSQGVIGTVNVLKGQYGTMNPESVCEYRGRVFWLDIESDRIIQYSVNGLFPISNYNMTRFWRMFCRQFQSMSIAAFESVGSRPFVFMNVDPYHDELLISIPKLLNQPPKGYLPDYPETIYPFDIYDGQAKVLMYKLDETRPRWQGAMTMYTPQIISFKDKLYTTLQNDLWIHNETNSYCKFFGVQYKSRVMPMVNSEPSMVKIVHNIKIEANMIPTLTYLYSLTPYQQATDLVDYEYTEEEGMYYGVFMRNKLVPTAEGMNTDGLLVGEKMRSYVFNLLLEFSVTNTPLNLRIFTVGMQRSTGHKFN